MSDAPFRFNSLVFAVHTQYQHSMKLIPLTLLAPMITFASDFPAPSSLPVVPTLPNPLVACDGTAIKTREQWETLRRPELRALFEHYMYGRQPAKPARTGVKLRVADKAALGGAATLREFDVELGLERPARLLVVTPNGKSVPAACFLGLNFGGNHQLLDHPGIAVPEIVVQHKDGAGSGEAAKAQDRGKESDVWNITRTIQRGYAVASFFQGDVVPDDAASAEPILRRLSGNPATERGPADTATIMAWAWGFSRMLDALETLPEIDARRVATVGHSRNGKTALLAAAFDERFALAIASQAGCGGSAPSRVAPELAKPNAQGRPTVETLAMINKNFPHWFAGNFKAFNDQPARLPFDQHCLIALCAPRPVLLSCASEDLWANPAGQFEMLRAADRVYRLLAGDGLGAQEKPEIGRLLPSRLGYFIRDGKHSMNGVDWAAWLDYADLWLRAKR
jgi:dienelactone hydrolase